MNSIRSNATVAIIGGGTSGLSLATALRNLGVGNVIILERDIEAGGVPRHCGHYPFGLREFKRPMKGPDYARALVQRALCAGVTIRTNTTVTALHPMARLSLATSNGESELTADRIVLCTGVRESSRAQHFLSGTRPQGILTTGALQSMAYLHHKRPFKRPVIIGTELVSLSAIMTCRHMGIRPVAMIERNRRIIARQIMRPYPALNGIPIKFGAKDLTIIGGKTVEAIKFTDRNNRPQILETDGILITGGFRPESALLYASHIEIDPATGGPSIDQFGRTSDPVYFATGNLLRPVETSAWCWNEAVETARRLVSDLENPIGKCPIVPLIPDDPAIRFVVPQRLALARNNHAMETLQIRLSAPTSGYISAVSNNKTLWSDFLQSRPERRIIFPLSPILNARPTNPVTLKVFGN